MFHRLYKFLAHIELSMTKITHIHVVRNYLDFINIILCLNFIIMIT